MPHTLTVADLDDFEADHIGEILAEYKRKMLAKKLEAMVEDYRDGGSRVEWYDSHIAWHDEIMKKVVWTKNE